MKRVRILTGLGQGGILDEEFFIRDDQYVEVESKGGANELWLKGDSELRTNFKGDHSSEKKTK